jgi:hypothetical protein
MKAALIQRTITVLEDVITGIHEKKADVKLWRKQWNAEIDRVDAEASDNAAVKEHREWLDEQVGRASKFIRKGRKKVKELEELQRVLKSELKGQQSIEAWVVEDDAFWLQQAQVAQQEGYAVTYSYEEAAKAFGETD